MPRAVAFSGKAKKAQLRARKQRLEKRYELERQTGELVFVSEVTRMEKALKKKKKTKEISGGKDGGRYALKFMNETEEEIKKKKEAARQSLHKVQENQLEINAEEYFPPGLSIPQRPSWNFKMSKGQIEAQEKQYFNNYLAEIENNHNLNDLSYFELNLETWRQLWRVVEMSDIVLVIVDIRFAALMFPPSVYEYVHSVLGKEIIIVLNKIDLIPASLVVAWKNYFAEKYQNLHILTFTSFPGYNVRGNLTNKAGMNIRRKRGRMKMAAEGAQKLLEACQDIVKDEVDLSSWRIKITEEMDNEYENDELEIGEMVEVKSVNTDFEKHDKFDGGVLTIGCIGQPNVGKSSLMNAIMGKKVVSVSKTPGHTKHFQTIYLTSKVRLCDCPGLVFPSKVPKPLQVLMGSYPVSQLREPYSSVRYLAERMDLIKLLKIRHPQDGEDEWSAMDICDGWSLKKGYLVAKTAWPDSYRGANSLLRMAVEGNICLTLYPPEFTKNREKWENHREIQEVKWIQATKADIESQISEEDDDDVSENSEEEEPNEIGESSASGSKQSVDNENSEEEESDEGTASGNKFAALTEDD